MLNFSQLTQDQFSRPETLQAVKAEAFDLVDHLMVPESKKLAEQLEDRLKTMPAMASSAPEIYSQYQKMIIYLRLTALMAQDNNMVLELIQKNYLDSFEAGLDMNERMTGKMYSIPDLVWPEYAEQLAYALKQNAQKIGQQPIVISGETAPQPQAIQNWLIDYDRALGPDLKTNLEQEEYLARNPNAKLLNEAEKAKLRNVLKFYNNLKPIPTAVIDKTLKDIGVYDEPAKEYNEATPDSRPYIITEPTIIQAPKRYTRPDGRDQYLEPTEGEPKTKPAPFVPPSSPRPAPPSQPAYTRPPAPTFTPPPEIPKQVRDDRIERIPPQPQPPPQPPKPTPQPVPMPQPFRPAPPPTPQYPQPQPPQPKPDLSSSSIPKNPYLEPINIPELPKTPTPPKPEPDPRIQGNIIDLKNRESTRE